MIPHAHCSSVLIQRNYNPRQRTDFHDPPKREIGGLSVIAAAGLLPKHESPEDLSIRRPRLLSEIRLELRDRSSDGGIRTRPWTRPLMEKTPLILFLR